MTDVLDDAGAPAAHRPPTVSTGGLSVIGYVDERSIHAVSGWIWLPDDPHAQPAFEVVLPMPDGSTQVLVRGVATNPTPHLQSQGVGNGKNGFSVVLPRLLTPEERDRVEVRADRSPWPLPMSPWLKTEYQPIGYVAMDIVNNCNIRCPFCVYDYKDTKNTKFMTDDTFETVLRIMPYTADGCFWLSCLHEPTMHPKLLEFIQRVPPELRRKLMFTSNITKRLPESFFDGLARSGMDHINISFESNQPDVYMKMRKGARYDIFKENRAKLVAAFAAAQAEGIKIPKLRYIMLAYKSNAEELPELAASLAEEPTTFAVQIRDTMPVPHIPKDFVESEFLDRPGWERLYQRVKPLLKGKVTLFLTPAYLEGKEDAVLLEDSEPVTAPPPPAAKLAPGIHQTVNLRIEWDGTLEVQGTDVHFQDPAWHLRLVKTKVQFLRDPLQFLTAL